MHQQITERKNATRQKENHLPWAGSCMGQHHVTLSRYLKGRAEEGSEALLHIGLTPNEVSVVKRATYIFGQAHMYAMHIL